MASKKLSQYVDELKETITPKTIRAPESVWKAVEELSQLYECSINTMVIILLTKGCNDEKR